MKLSMQAAFHVMLMKDVTVDGPCDWLRLEAFPGDFYRFVRNASQCEAD
jgi:hypothetical protein